MIDNNWLSSLKKFDRERFNSLQHLSVEKRKKIAAIYFFNLELANIAWNVTEPELRYLKLRWWEEFVKSINTESFFKPNEYLSILSNLVSEKVLSKNDLLRLINAREFDCSNKPFDSLDQQMEYLRDTSQNLLFMGLSCLQEFSDKSLRKNLSEYFGLSLGLARFILAAGSLRKNKCYSFFLPSRIDYDAFFQSSINDNIKERVRSDIDFIFHLIEKGDKELKCSQLRKKSFLILNTVKLLIPSLKVIKNKPELIFRDNHKISFKTKFIGKLKELIT